MRKKFLLVLTALACMSGMSGWAQNEGKLTFGVISDIHFGNKVAEGPMVKVPQALKNILPTLCNEFITLLKETSVAGYIALQDLTKGGDIIRSRTYSAFMPLIAVALIYLVMVLVLTNLIRRLERRLKRSER
jgi:ABC-type arginine/histidine transport system permease subunit